METAIKMTNHCFDWKTRFHCNGRVSLAFILLHFGVGVAQDLCHRETNLFTEWQGGRNDPPWMLLENDQTSSRFALLGQNRLPAGIKLLRNLLDMGDNESELWHQHVIRGQIRELSVEETFQFAQPHPGQFERMLQTTIHPDARLHYPLESLGYLTFLERTQALWMIQRSDELLSLDLSIVYKSLNTSTESHLWSQLANNEVGLGLLDRLSQHDLVGSHHVSTFTHTIDMSMFICAVTCKFLVGTNRWLPTY
jgi:hypothetical protein